MFTKPNLLFINGIEEIIEEDLGLSAARALHQQEERQRLQVQRIYDGYTFTSDNYLAALNSDLVHAFTPPVTVFTVPRFAEDLNLELVVRNFFETQFTHRFQQHVLSHAPVDLATIAYRWEILDELSEQENLIGVLRDLGLQLVTVYKQSLERHNVVDTLQGLEFSLLSATVTKELLKTEHAILKGYIEAIKAMHKAFEHATSRGLQQLRIYAERIMETEEFKALDEMMQRYDNAQYVELGIVSNAIGEIQKVHYFGQGKNNLPRGLLAEMHPTRVMENMAIQRLEKANFNALLVRAFEGFITEMEKQIMATVYLVGDFEFYTGAMNYRKVLERSGLPITRPTLHPALTRTHTIQEAYSLLIPSSWHESTCHEPEFWIYKERVVPNGFVSNPDHNQFLLTGANNGGKTRYTTTIGLCIDLGQSGLWVAAENAEYSLVDNIFTHFVSGDDAENSCGRWVGEIERVKAELQMMTPYSISLIDDFGSGTNYLEARGPALTVLYAHYRLGATLIMNTHLHQLAEDAERGIFPGLSNWKMEIGEGLQYTYKVIPGRAETSHAADIATLHGLSTQAVDAMILTRTAQRELSPALVRPAFDLQIT
jgi:DNA mismatch repair ATPase MutS